MQSSSPTMPSLGTRNRTTLVAGIFYLITIPFLILVLIGNTSDSYLLRDTWFFKLDVSHIIPISVANSNLLNSVARSLGLHDYYQVGVWNFCEGYDNEGITYCSKPKTFYWFNPVEILRNELLSGAKIALPSQVLTILRLLELGSNVMYVFFMIGAVLNFVLLLVTPLAIRSRLWTIPIAVLALISALVTAVAAIIATVISVAAKIALTAQDQLDITAQIGIRMFVFMWIAAVGSVVAFFLHAAMSCCCSPHKQSGAGTGAAISQDHEYKEKTSIPLPSFVRRRKRGSFHATSSALTTTTQ